MTNKEARNLKSLLNKSEALSLKLAKHKSHLFVYRVGTEWKVGAYVPSFNVRAEVELSDAIAEATKLLS